MKIGILSMQKILNYGSFLQAFSLKLQLEKRGHDVYFVDIKPGRQLVVPEIKKNVQWYLSKIDCQIFRRIDNYFFSKKMDKVHRKDYTQYLNVDKYNDGSTYDLVIIGSDEVFNATISSAWGFSTQLFGNVSNAQKVVTYAACCGSTTYKDVVRYEIVGEIKNAMKNLTSISVRDTNTCDFVNNILGRRPDIHVDPVFLSDFDNLIPENHYNVPFLLVYAYGNRISSKEEINAINEYAEKHCLEIISVGIQHRWCKHNIIGNAFDLLSYFKKASYVITDTFHGTVFSIKYNKPFISIVRTSNENKLKGLLKQFDLEDRQVRNFSQFEEMFSKRIDYSRINSIIDIEVDKACSYIDKITKNI